MIVITTLLVSCLKVMLMPAYHSTDFEVHRNWLAITHTLPVKKWYFENTSEWTLDYPPLFAWFEYTLSHFAKVFDPNMVVVENLNYVSDVTIFFQRLSVIITDLCFSFAVYKCSLCLPKSWRTEVVLPLILITNSGLIMVDHIHFQYNGFMFGIFLLSMVYIIQGDYLTSAFLFTILLNMKHIFIYLAPAYFIFLLRNYCLKPSVNLKNIPSIFNIKNTVFLGLLVTGIFLLTYIPFYDHLGQVISRLFPFKRGLCHAYWAPNFWALYNFGDKALLFLLKQMYIITESKPVASMTGGLVQEFQHSVLPSITPNITLAVTVVMICPALVKLWTLGSKPLHFARCLVLCALTSFLFGWHVHEKAILMAVIPLSVLSVLEVGDAKVFVLLSTVGHYSLLPLLFPNSVLMIKLLLLILHSLYVFQSLSSMYPLQICKYNLPLLNAFESLYILLLIPIFLYENIFHGMFGLSATLPFLPLMITSVYCSLGIIYCWLKYYLYFMVTHNVSLKTKRKNK